MPMPMASTTDYEGEPSRTSAFGCLLVLLPFLTFFFVWPDAIHVWRQPWSDLSLWIVGTLVAWVSLISLLSRVGGLRRSGRVMTYCALVALSVSISLAIAASV